MSTWAWIIIYWLQINAIVALCLADRALRQRRQNPNKEHPQC